MCVFRLWRSKVFTMVQIVKNASVYYDHGKDTSNLANIFCGVYYVVCWGRIRGMIHPYWGNARNILSTFWGWIPNQKKNCPKRISFLHGTWQIISQHYILSRNNPTYSQFQCIRRAMKVEANEKGWYLVLPLCVLHDTTTLFFLHLHLRSSRRGSLFCPNSHPPIPPSPTKPVPPSQAIPPPAPHRLK